MNETSRLKIGVTLSLLALGVVFVVGLLWTLFSSGLDSTAGFGSAGWFLFSFAFGLTMIVMPCTLPLAFVIVPLAMGKGMAKGLGMALSFGAGVALMLSLYGVVAAALGKVGIDFLGAGGEDIKNWIYFFAGIFAFTFALGEIGLIKLHMPSYTGSAPDFVQQRKDYTKAFLLGLFLGNVGVGCPHPATPLILIEIASTGDIFYGWALFFVHAIGRVVPLLFLALLGVLGVNGLNWLVARKDRIERATGWAMVYVAGFILTLGLFSHDWWVNSGQHNLLEKITQESWFNASYNTQLGQSVAHVHGLEVGTGIFGQPLWWGNWFLVFLWVLPLWWYYARERRRILRTPALQLRHIEEKITKLETERRNHEMILHLPEGDQGARLRELESQIDALEKERRIFEESMRYGVESGMRDAKDQEYEETALRLRRNWYLALTIFFVTTFAVFLPMWFAKVASMGDHADATAPSNASTVKVGDAIKALGGGNRGTTETAAMPMDESMPHAH